MTTTPVVLPWSLPELAARARRLAEPGHRRLLGLTGQPGAGKSTLADALCDHLGPLAARVPMDGFHLANRVLGALGLADRKGAPETFDAHGFKALLERLRDNDDAIVYAPEFYREIEEPIAGSLPVPRDVPLVIVEGNYILLDDGPWHGISDFFDEIWYLQVDDAVRQERLIRRHELHGRTPQDAHEWTLGNDERNSRLVAGTASRADVRVVVPAK